MNLFDLMVVLMFAHERFRYDPAYLLARFFLAFLSQVLKCTHDHKIKKSTRI